MERKKGREGNPEERKSVTKVREKERKGRIEGRKNVSKGGRRKTEEQKGRRRDGMIQEEKQKHGHKEMKKGKTERKQT